MDYGDSIGLGNITENWLFQFGFYNGDTDGNGDGGFSAVTQSSSGAANLTKIAITSDTATTIYVDDTSVFVVGDFIKIDSEILKITGISGSITLYVSRAQLGSGKATHSVDVQIYWYNYFPMAFADATYETKYYRGVVTNRPTIRDSINLQKSTAKTGNLSVVIPDFNYEGVPVSRELFGGTRSYINQEVKIFCKVNQDDEIQIGSYRLTDIETDGNTINLSLTSHRPWDFITFPQDKSDANTYIPVVYGDYTPNTCRHGAYTPNDSLDLFPAPVDYITSNIHCVVPRALDGTSGNEARLHFWDKTAEQFCPILSTNGTAFYNDASFENNSINYSIATPTLHRAYMAKPRILKKDFSTANYTSWSDTTNIENAVDDRYNTPSTSSFTSSTISLSLAGNSGDNNLAGQVLFMYPLLFEGKAEYIVLTVTSEIANISQTGNAHGHSSGNVNYLIFLDGILGAGELCRRLSTTTNNTTFTGDSGVTTDSSSDFKTNYNNNKGWDEDDLQLNASIQIFDDNYAGTSTAQADFKIYDVVQTVRAQFEDMEAKNNGATKTKFLYLGCNGLTKSYSGGSGAVTHIHEAHRDLIKKFTGTDDSDSNIDGWSSLNTSRTQSGKEWKIRYWNLEPKELKKELEKLQYEGGFIYRFKADGSMQYIHIPDSPSASATLTKADISSIVIMPTSFSDLVTKMDVNYKRHSAEKKYLKTVSASNSSARKSYNIKTQENLKKVNLDAYVAPDIPTSPAGNKNDDFFSYYSNIHSDIKIIVQCQIVNPKFYELEVGDFISFSDMYPETPFGFNSATWSGLVFIITEMRRSLGTINIKARQI